MWDRHSSARLVPDLDKRLLVGGHNYQRFIQLLPSSWAVGVKRSVYIGPSSRIVFGVAEETRYTTLVRLEQHYAKPEPWLERHVMWVRVYHDARLAEVVGFGGYDLQAYHELPDPKRYPLEQEKLDELLCEWLELGLRYS